MNKGVLRGTLSFSVRSPLFDDHSVSMAHRLRHDEKFQISGCFVHYLMRNIRRDFHVFPRVQRLAFAGDFNGRHPFKDEKNCRARP